jgi:hypothetical protein
MTSSSPYYSRGLRTPQIERGGEGEEARDDGQAVAPAMAETALRCGRVGAGPAPPCRFFPSVLATERAAQRPSPRALVGVDAPAGRRSRRRRRGVAARKSRCDGPHQHAAEKIVL